MSTNLGELLKTSETLNYTHVGILKEMLKLH